MFCSSSLFFVGPGTFCRTGHIWRISYLHYLLPPVFYKSWKRRLWVPPIEWLKLNFARCIVHQTRSLGVLIQEFIYNMVFVNKTYDMVINTQFRKIYRRSFARVLLEYHWYVLSSWYKSVTPLDATRVNRTFFHNHSVHWYSITRMEGRDYI